MKDSQKEDLERESVEFMTELGVVQGIPDLVSRIFATVFLEPKEIAMEEIAKKTGYGLSSVSSAMKMLEPLHFIRRIKKPGSKKVYFYMEKDMAKIMRESLQRKLELVVKPGKEKLPIIIAQYEQYLKKHHDNEIKQKLEILKNYHKTVLEMEKTLKKITGMM